MALSPMARQVAQAADRQKAVQQAQLEAAACTERLHALEQSHAEQLHTADAQKQECLRVSCHLVNLSLPDQARCMCLACTHPSWQHCTVVSEQVRKRLIRGAAT